jgi:aspartate carbamoyltransferase regulatory subunit
MLNIESIKDGIVIDHIKAGLGAKIFSWLGLDKAEYSVALIINAPSKAMGKKDIIKIDNIINIDYSILGFIDPNITVNIIKNETIAEKITLTLPEKIEGVIKCKNPRCITTTETYETQIFHLVDKEKGQYRCGYCDELTSSRNF